MTSKRGRDRMISYAGRPDQGDLAPAIRVVDHAITALVGLRDSLGPELLIVARHLAECRGRIVFTGMGKSGIAARKLAATFASLGKPALFLHAADAAHGDLGKMCTGDVLVAISVSGETRIVLPMLHYAREAQILSVALTARLESSLAQQADYVLALPTGHEGGPIAAVPMASTVATLALGDALAALVANRNRFSDSDVAVLHPGGRIGQKLRPVRLLMHAGGRMPLVAADAPGAVVVDEITSKGFGIAGVIDPASERLIGVVSDGDLRRHLGEIGTLDARGLMNDRPVTLAPHETADHALDLARAHRISAIFVVDPVTGAAVGLVDLQDLLRVSID
ncbi:arabinose-5-phosphate isomerase [Novosphingobium kunmingense]|uniref:Arabinose-5-phosphate isomerase n=1 Tax=Novosphingobium kunmingense TaxID=1211806 RepID=A0A2N0HJB0_9SPHN|nr:SIS domain-containing protein [Novosphingobium kunmingense]PKB19011.1 arabinose-5-phosphate isomerase [Novosphingobium kunmingense]